jgi:hypothetical protein
MTAGKSDGIPPMPSEIEWTSQTAKFYDAWNPRPGRALTAFRYLLFFVSMQGVLFGGEVWIRAASGLLMMYALGALTAWGGSHWKGFRQGWVASQIAKEKSASS